MIAVRDNATSCVWQSSWTFYNLFSFISRSSSRTFAKRELKPAWTSSRLHRPDTEAHWWRRCHSTTIYYLQYWACLLFNWTRCNASGTMLPRGQVRGKRGRSRSSTNHLIWIILHNDDGKLRKFARFYSNFIDRVSPLGWKPFSWLWRHEDSNRKKRSISSSSYFCLKRSSLLFDHIR